LVVGVLWCDCDGVTRRFATGGPGEFRREVAEPCRTPRHFRIKGKGGP